MEFNLAYGIYFGKSRILKNQFQVPLAGLARRARVAVNVKGTAALSAAALLYVYDIRKLIKMNFRMLNPGKNQGTD